jgi:hypothetical protein
MFSYSRQGRSYFQPVFSWFWLCDGIDDYKEPRIVTCSLLSCVLECIAFLLYNPLLLDVAGEESTISWKHQLWWWRGRWQTATTLISSYCCILYCEVYVIELCSDDNAFQGSNVIVAANNIVLFLVSATKLLRTLLCLSCNFIVYTVLIFEFSLFLPPGIVTCFLVRLVCKKRIILFLSVFLREFLYFIYFLRMRSRCKNP